MLIDVQVNYYRTNRIVSVDANTLRVEVDRLRSDPSILYYELVGTTDPVSYTHLLVFIPKRRICETLRSIRYGRL